MIPPFPAVGVQAAPAKKCYLPDLQSLVESNTITNCTEGSVIISPCRKIIGAVPLFAGKESLRKVDHREMIKAKMDFGVIEVIQTRYFQFRMETK
jgi:hypothetical protein